MTAGQTYCGVVVRMLVLVEECGCWDGALRKILIYTVSEAPMIPKEYQSRAVVTRDKQV